jgi:hypothetical protein
MPAKKKPTETQPIPGRRPRSRKKSTTEPLPAAPEPQPKAPQPVAAVWSAPAAIVLTVALLTGLVLESRRPLELAAAVERMARAQTSPDPAPGVPQGSAGDAVASAERRSRLCQDGLRSMVRLWNRYVRELRAAESGSRARFRAAERRFNAAKRKASRAIRRCEGA